MHVPLLRHLQEPKKSPHFSFFFSLRKIFLEQIMACLRRMRAENVDGFCGFSPSPAVDAGEHEDVHVLAVDDSLVDRKVIEHLLKIISCKVTVVDSGRRALQFLGLDHEEESSVGFDGLKVDLIITDYCMPGMTGYELLKKIKGSSIFRETPVVIMSSENVLPRIHRCLEEGAEDFIVKPVKLSDVRRLKSYMFSEDQGEKQDKGINKRKLQETSVDDLSSPIASPSPSKSSDLSSTPSPPSTSFPSSPRLIVSSEAESGSKIQQVQSKQ